MAKASGNRRHQEPDNRHEHGMLMRAFLKAVEYTVPLSWKGLLAIVLYNQLMFPLTGTLFPSGEDFVKDQGWDPAIIETLGAKNARVMESDVWGRLQSLSFMPVLPAFVMAAASPTPSDFDAYASHGIPYSLHTLMDFCHIHLSNPEASPASFIMHMSEGKIRPDELSTDLDLTSAEIFFYITAHELRHCNPDNRKLAEPMVEADADAAAIRLAMGQFDNPALAQTFTLLRAFSLYDEAHDTTLYLDAVFGGKPIPDVASINAALREVRALMERHPGLKEKDRLAAILKDHGDTMSPLAKRRVELYLEAHDYFRKPEVAPVTSATARAFTPAI